MIHLKFIATGILNLVIIAVIFATLVTFPIGAAFVLGLGALILFCWIMGQNKNENLD